MSNLVKLLQPKEYKSKINFFVAKKNLKQKIS